MQNILPVLCFLGGFLLAQAASREEVEHDRGLGRVAEVVADDRLEHVIHQVLDRPDAADDLGRIQRADVDDLGHV